jgi:hypothetical protein
MTKWVQRAALLVLYVIFTIVDDLDGGEDREGLWDDMMDIWNDCPSPW